MAYPNGGIRGQFAIAAMLLALTACGGGGGGEEAPPPPPLQPTLASIQANVFTPSCAKVGCHDVGAIQGLRLDAGFSRTNLVMVPSTLDGSLTRVIPGNADASLLIQKLENTQSVGMRMPADGPPFLQQTTINVIREWIDVGAP